MEFKYFPISKVFNYKRGRRLIKLNQIDGDVAYISSTKFNNGIDNYIIPPKYMTIYENCITIANSGSVGYAFYHDYKFVASDHVTVIWLKDRPLNKYIAMYLITILRELKENYFFNREMSDKRLAKDFIKLPIYPSGKINWEYMEEQIKGIVPLVKWEKPNIIKESSKVQICDVKNFPLSSIFNIRSIRGKISKKDLKDGDYLYITTSNKNFGFSGFHNKYSEEGNVFTIDSATDGKCFFQSEKFIGSDHVEILEVKNEYKKFINKYTVIYLQTLLNFYLDKYEYSRKRAQKRIELEYLSLPIDEKCKINWEYMEKYIKTLPYAEFL